MKVFKTMKKNLEFQYKYGFKTKHQPFLRVSPGISRDKVLEISYIKKEPEWMRDFRLMSFDIFLKKKMPEWGPDLSEINFDDITYFLKPTDRQANSWQDLPVEIKKTYDLLGIPEAEKKFLAGVSAQFESEVVYDSIKKEIEKQGVIFCDMDKAVKNYPEIVKRHFGKLIPPGDNKFAALNSSVWSGGSFVWVPKGVKVALPLQAYFRINTEKMGQFERTLIIAEEGSDVHYVEGCTAPVYSSSSLHAAVVEIFAYKGSRVRYTTVQNWSDNVFNLVTKRARAEAEAVVQWVDCNIGSKVTMKYPSVILAGRKAKGETISLAYARKNQIQDTGSKMIHLAPETSSRILSKSVSLKGGRTSYRGLVRVVPGAKNSSSYVSCDALILDKNSRSDTYPTMNIQERECSVQHEATVERIGKEKLFYFASRGIKKEKAEGLLVNGFIKPVVKEIPLEYSVELHRLINLEMEGTVG